MPGETSKFQTVTKLEAKESWPSGPFKVSEGPRVMFEPRPNFHQFVTLTPDGIIVHRRKGHQVIGIQIPLPILFQLAESIQPDLKPAANEKPTLTKIG